MTQSFYNRFSTKAHRRELRNNPTRAEAELWNGLRNKRAGGYKFRRQHGLGPFIVDFYCAEAHLVIEVDGATHDTPEQQADDERRSQFLEQEGFHILRFTDGEVLWSVDACVARILERIEQIISGDR